MSPPRKGLFSDYGKASFSSNGEQLRQKTALGTSLPRLSARRGCPTGARARGYARKNLSPLCFTPPVQHQSVPLSVLLPILTHVPFFSSKTRFSHTLFSIHPHVALHTVPLRLSAFLSFRVQVVLPQLFLTCNSKKMYLQRLLMSTKSHCAKLK